MLSELQMTNLEREGYLVIEDLFASDDLFPVKPVFWDFRKWPTLFNMDSQTSATLRFARSRVARTTDSIICYSYCTNSYESPQ